MFTLSNLIVRQKWQCLQHDKTLQVRDMKWKCWATHFSVDIMLFITSWQATLNAFDKSRSTGMKEKCGVFNLCFAEKLQLHGNHIWHEQWNIIERLVKTISTIKHYPISLRNKVQPCLRQNTMLRVSLCNNVLCCPLGQVTLVRDFNLNEALPG